MKPKLIIALLALSILAAMPDRDAVSAPPEKSPDCRQAALNAHVQRWRQTIVDYRRSNGRWVPRPGWTDERLDAYDKAFRDRHRTWRQNGRVGPEPRVDPSLFGRSRPWPARQLWTRADRQAAVKAIKRRYRCKP